MNDTDVPQGTQQAGNEIHNNNTFIDTVKDQGVSVQGTIGSKAADLAMQQKLPYQEEDIRSMERQDISSGSNTRNHRNTSSVTLRACTTCQQTTDTESTCQCTSFHKSSNPETYTNLTFKPHERRENVRTGHVYRIWQPENTIMHLGTVLIMIDRARSWSACKILQEQTVRRGSHYKEYCAPIHEHTADHQCTEVNRYIKQAECHPLTIYPASTQKFHQKCWVDLERSYDIGNEGNYEFVYCGAMDKKSFKYAKEKHLELYGD